MAWKEISSQRGRELPGSCEQILRYGYPDFALGMARFSPLLQMVANDSEVFQAACLDFLLLTNVTCCLHKTEMVAQGKSFDALVIVTSIVMPCSFLTVMLLHVACTACTV